MPSKLIPNLSQKLKKTVSQGQSSLRKVVLSRKKRCKGPEFDPLCCEVACDDGTSVKVSE